MRLLDIILSLLAIVTKVQGCQTADPNVACKRAHSGHAMMSHHNTQGRPSLWMTRFGQYLGLAVSKYRVYTKEQDLQRQIYGKPRCDFLGILGDPESSRPQHSRDLPRDKEQ